MGKNIAPWSEEQVKNLNNFQNSGAFHPFTCAYCRDNPKNHDKNGFLTDDFQLVATKDGWICKTCDYKQDWAHEFMIIFNLEEWTKNYLSWMQNADI